MAYVTEATQRSIKKKYYIGNIIGIYIYLLEQ